MLVWKIIQSNEEKKIVEREQIPIEICPTSNCMTLGLKSLHSHPVIMTLMKTTPTSINTDDMIVFDTHLSDEVWSIASFLQWEVRDVVQYEQSIVDQILDESDPVRSFILARFERFLNSC